MKRCVIFIAILAAWMFIGVQSAVASGIDISAKVNPNWDNSWDETELTGTALYTISVHPDSTYGANFFQLTFEGDVFASITPGEISRSDWSLYALDQPDQPYDKSPGNAQWLADGYIPLIPGESISFLVNYTLDSAEQYYKDSGSDWNWDHGSWQQLVTAMNVSPGVWLPPAGSALTVHTPEPATMLLFGSGLIGLGWIGRRKTKKK